MRQPPRVDSGSGDPQGIEAPSVDLAVDFAGISLSSPIVTASGTFGSGYEYGDFVHPGELGAVITKGVAPVAWPGNPGVRIVETASGMLNSIGLQNPGVEEFCRDSLAVLNTLTPRPTVLVNVVGHRASEYAQVVERLESEQIVAGYEINVSCPNLDEGGMAFGTSCDSVTEITTAVRAATSRPVIVKLTPNVTDVTEVARAAEAAGADGVSLINTLLGMAVDPYRRKPVLHRVVGGLSGPAIKPVALRMVWEVSRAVSVPVLGTGGVSTGLDVAEFMLAGATAVAVGTANFTDPTATVRCIRELQQFCADQGVNRAADLVGALEIGPR